MSVVGAPANTSRQSPRSWNSPDAVRKISLVSSSTSSTNARVSSSTRRRLQRRLSLLDLKNFIAEYRVRSEPGQLLHEGEDRREQIPLALHPPQHLVVFEHEQRGVL